MGKTIANVLKGVAILEIKEPDSHRAEWSTEKVQTGSYSAKLSKPATGNYGSTHIEITPLPAAAEKDLGDLMGADSSGNEWGWSHWRSGVAAYWEQMELRFEDQVGEGWIDITIQRDVMATGGENWVEVEQAHGDVQAMFGGWHASCGPFSRWTLTALTSLNTEIEAVMETAGTPTDTVQNQADWVLTRCRIELWETVWERYVYIDDIQLGGVNHTLEPGGATPGMLLSSDFTEVGYTEDGVTITYTADTVDIEVEEETFPIDSVISKESCEVTCNMAESSLFNMDKAMAGALFSGNILKLGAGTQKKMVLGIRGTNPAGFPRSIMIPSCVATGAVGMSYRRAEKVVIPVTFRALKTTGHPAVTIVDSAA